MPLPRSTCVHAVRTHLPPHRGRREHCHDSHKRHLQPPGQREGGRAIQRRRELRQLRLRVQPAEGWIVAEERVCGGHGATARRGAPHARPVAASVLASCRGFVTPKCWLSTSGADDQAIGVPHANHRARAVVVACCGADSTCAGRCAGWPLAGSANVAEHLHLLACTHVREHCCLNQAAKTKL
jgi:hypothetical protein